VDPPAKLVLLTACLLGFSVASVVTQLVLRFWS
jgi:hypothetical protein